MRYIAPVLIYIKRALKHAGILLMLASIPLTAFIYSSLTAKNEGAAVGVYDSGSADEIIEALRSTDEFIHFVLYDDIEKMKNDVGTQKLECGFILPEHTEDLLTGSAEIIYGEGYTSVMSEVTKEAVFSAVLKTLGSETALNFSRKNNMDINEENFRRAYSDYLGSIKSAVEFEEVSTANKEIKEESNALQCIAAILTMCAGLIGAGFVTEDKKRGIRISSGSNIAAVMLLFAAAEAAAFAVIGYRPDVVRLFFMNTGAWGMSSILALIIKDERIPRLLMPVCMAVVLIFDYIDISLIMPSLKIFDYFLLSHYYIYSELPKLAVLSILLGTAGFFANRKTAHLY